MINKIEKLTSIGKYRNFVASGQTNFKKMTLIYGDNGGGKTTLTSVFRSLSTDTPEIITSRISTNHTAPQSAQISQIGTPLLYHTFGARGWSSPLPDIEIFDIHFINENIFTGFDFNDDQRKQLHKFVVGAQGISIQNQIEQNKADKVSSKQIQNVIENQILQQVGNNLTSDLVTPFLSITRPHAVDIEQQILKAEASLLNANANSIIQTLQTLTPLTQLNFDIDFASLNEDINTTSQSIQNAALQSIFSNHCHDLESNSVDGAESWLQIGFRYFESKQKANISNVTCPFCKQSIGDSLDVIRAYTNKFNADFNSFIVRLQVHQRIIQEYNFDVEIQAIKSTYQSNIERIATWTLHLPNTIQTPILNLITHEEEFKVAFQKLFITVQQKIQNPSIAESTTDAMDLQTLLQTINDLVDGYNQTLISYNEAITTFRAGIQSVASAQLEVFRLKRIQKRFEIPIADLCTQLKAEKQRYRTLEQAYTPLIQQQLADATLFFTNYQTRINYYLGTVFKTLFRIENVIHIPPQGRATQSKINYKLTIDGKDISFIPNLPFSAKECLSEGDKSTIALAFFLSKLDIDPNKQDKILIFDDPLSSLDTNRRTYTIGIIKELFQQMKQVVVLSHNEYFLNEISKDIAVSVKATLRITENFAAKSSKIEECDLDELVKNDYFKHIEALEDFRINPDLAKKDAVLGWLRNVLESHLRFKFYKEIRPLGGHKTFGRVISFLESSGVVFRDNGNRPTIIANLKLINSVSWMPHHGIPMPIYSTLGINPNSITASELDNLIQDTLNLIENQL